MDVISKAFLAVDKYGERASKRSFTAFAATRLQRGAIEEVEIEVWARNLGKRSPRRFTLGLA